MPILQARKTLTIHRDARRYAWMPTAVLSLTLVAALFLRLWIAPHEGYGFDVGTNKGWAFSAVHLGPGPSYTQQLKGSMLPNYLPFSLLVFHATGWGYMHTVSPSLDIDAPFFQTVIKLPAIIADLLTVLVLGLLVARQKKSRWWGVAAAALYAFHPAPIHDSALWGQTDSIYSLFLVCTFGTVAYGFSLASGMFMALALLTKLQAASCVPLFIVLALRSGWREALKMFIGGCIATILVLFPYWLDGSMTSVQNVYTSSVGFYDSVSSAAYNVWWAMFGDAAGNMHDTSLLFGFLSYRTTGMILWGLSILFPVAVLWRFLKPSPKTGHTVPVIFFTAAFSVLAFFLWNTQMHERYSFAFLPLGFVVAFTSGRAARLYIFLSLCIYLNLLGWLHAGWFDRLLFDTFPMLDVFIASSFVLGFFAYGRFGLELQTMLTVQARPVSGLKKMQQHIVRWTLRKKI